LAIVSVLKHVYVAVAALFAACVVVQVFLAGLAIFVGPSAWALHTGFIHYFEYLPILLLAIALIGRMRGLRWPPLVLLLLIGVQYATAEWADPSSRAVAAIHPVSAMIIFQGAIWLTWRAWRSARAAVPASGHA
jgi:hypothetical protein